MRLHKSSLEPLHMRPYIHYSQRCSMAAPSNRNSTRLHSRSQRTRNPELHRTKRMFRWSESMIRLWGLGVYEERKRRRSIRVSCKQVEVVCHRLYTRRRQCCCLHRMFRLDCLNRPSCKYQLVDCSRLYRTNLSKKPSVSSAYI